MSDMEGRGPADLGEATMPDTEDRDPSTQHEQTESPGDLDTTGESEKGIGDKLKGAVGGVIGKAKDMLGGDKG
jgi:hypothetical protein